MSPNKMTSIHNPLKDKYIEAATLYTALKALSSFNPFFKLPLEKVMLAKGFTKKQNPRTTASSNVFVAQQNKHQPVKQQPLKLKL